MNKLKGLTIGMVALVTITLMAIPAMGVTAENVELPHNETVTDVSNETVYIQTNTINVTGINETAGETYEISIYGVENDTDTLLTNQSYSNGTSWDYALPDEPPYDTYKVELTSSVSNVTVETFEVLKLETTSDSSSSLLAFPSTDLGDTAKAIGIVALVGITMLIVFGNRE